MEVLMIIKPVENKSNTEIILEWDSLAKVRKEQIESGIDLSFNHILVPTILNLIQDCDMSKIVDIGCGSGTLTKMLFRGDNQIIGVDFSQENIKLASTGLTENGIGFVFSSIEEYAKHVEESVYTLAIANMTLMNVTNLDCVLTAIRHILKPNGYFVLSITHPCFWPWYWNYAKEPWFNYQKETFIEANFKISFDDSGGKVTTHIHRPLNMYFNSLAKAGFTVENIVEPMPNEIVENKYPEKWQYPRFLCMRCIANNA
jgi:2-polyprenyl-3-methyl-5-hydroxy-6-metoxy-1,4-benzoquinol methylase